jgi:hypothetical protein
MKQQLPRRQRGASILLVLIVVAALAFVGLVGAQVFPTYIEYLAVQKAVNKAKEGSSPVEARQIFEKASVTDDIKSVQPKDLEVANDGGKMVVRFAYQKEIHLAGPAYLVMKYAGQSK